jgi:DedD protein
MAIFKFRKSGDEQLAAPVQPESIEVMRRRAKHRLIGAAVLVLIGVVGFPMLFDKQPRPISVDIPIEIPDKNTVKPLNIPAPLTRQADKADLPVPVLPERPVSTPATAKAEQKLADPAGLAVPEAKKPIVKAEPGLVDDPKPQALPKSPEVAKAVVPSEGRFVVQVGAYADLTRAREVRLKMEHAGLKTYTQVTETKDGRRIRVRVGPFADKAEADKAAERIRKLALPAAILSL